MATREPYGVWGGFTEHERLQLLREGWSGTALLNDVDLRRLEARLRLTGLSEQAHMGEPGRLNDQARFSEPSR